MRAAHRRAVPSRRALLGGAGLLAAGLALVSCTSRRRDPAPAPTPERELVTEIGVVITAPSGQVSALLDQAGDSAGVVLRDAEGTDFWADDFSYTVTDPPGIAWETEADVLWVLVPGDPRRIARNDSGVWSQQAGRTPPDEIVSLEG